MPYRTAKLVKWAREDEVHFLLHRALYVSCIISSLPENDYYIPFLIVHSSIYVTMNFLFTDIRYQSKEGLISVVWNVWNIPFI